VLFNKGGFLLIQAACYGFLKARIPDDSKAACRKGVQMSRRIPCVLLSGVLFLAACADDGTAPEPEEILMGDDAQFVANLIDITTSGVLNDFFDFSGSDPANGPALGHEPVVWTRSFERSRACHEGGTLTVAGSGTSTWDGEAKTYDVVSSGTKTRAACAHARDDVIITLTGEANWTHERHYADHAPTGTWITTYLGGFNWAKSTGESGDCYYNLTRTIDTAENTRTLSGTLCGEEVNRSETWRDG
jgi:hypothetical protein